MIDLILSAIVAALLVLAYIQFSIIAQLVEAVMLLQAHVQYLLERDKK